MFRELFKSYHRVFSGCRLSSLPTRTELYSKTDLDCKLAIFLYLPVITSRPAPWFQFNVWSCAQLRHYLLLQGDTEAEDLGRQIAFQQFPQLLNGTAYAKRK